MLDSGERPEFVKCCKGGSMRAKARLRQTICLYICPTKTNRILTRSKTMRLRFGVGFYSVLLGVMLAGTSCSTNSSKGGGPETGLQPAPEKQVQTQTAPAPAQQASVP